MNDESDHLSESMRHVEHAALAHKAAVELAEDRRKQLQAIGERVRDLESELRACQRELDTVRIYAHDAEERAQKAEERLLQTTGELARWENCARNAAAVLVEHIRNRPVAPSEPTLTAPSTVAPPGQSRLSTLAAQLSSELPARARDLDEGREDRPPAPPRPEPSVAFRKG